MKSERKSPPMAEREPQKTDPAAALPLYPVAQGQAVSPDPQSPLPQFIQAWTAFTTLESLATQKIVTYYKTKPCGDPGCPRGKLCMHFHSLSERRRPPFFHCRLLYSHALCPYITQGLECEKGDQCEYSHTSEESLYHPAKYKTSMCLQGPICAQEVCPWAHLPEELRNAAMTQIYGFDPFPAFVQAYTLSVEPVTFASQYPASFPALDAELATFKTKPCTYQYQHNHKHCIYYHSFKDRRRVPGRYSAERCEASEDNSCVMGDDCPKSHSMVERLYHPDKYKTKYCNNYPERLQDCEYGSYCCFAHSDAELKVELSHNLEMDEDFFMYYFKTGWCPFNHEHNKAACVYAHNWQDFRRKPHLFHYSNELCPNWQSETFISEYKEGCVYEHNCGYCHGWKEQLYHPLTYKTLPCPDIKKCQKGLDCPYFHSEYDHRYPNKYSVFFPRPRSYHKNPNLTLTNNVNIQKEYELQQMAVQTLQQTPISIGFPHSGVTMSRRYSEEVHYGPSLCGHAPSGIKHRASYDLTPPVTVSPKLMPASPEKRTKAPVQLVHIREESPEQRDDDKLFEIFGPAEDSKTASTLYFSPKLGKNAGDGKRNTLCEEELAPVPELEIGKGHKSCPATPLPKRKSFVKSPVFEKLHLDATADPATKDNESKELKRVEKFLEGMGLGKLYPKFAAKGVTMSEIMIMSEEQYKELGIDSENEVRSIVAKVKENLEQHFEDDLDSPGIELCGYKSRVGREEPMCGTDEAEKEGPMKIFSYLDRK